MVPVIPCQTNPSPLDPLQRPAKVTREEFLNLFFAVMVPMFLAAIDQTLLAATATPEIAGSFGGLRDSSWIVVAYLLAAAVIVPMYGRLGDRLGKRRMLLVAVAVFALGSVISGLAQNMPQLIAGRVVQGLGGGGLMMLSHALIGELVPPVERIRFQGTSRSCSRRRASAARSWAESSCSTSVGAGSFSRTCRSSRSRRGAWCACLPAKNIRSKARRPTSAGTCCLQLAR